MESQVLTKKKPRLWLALIIAALILLAALLIFLLAINRFELKLTLEGPDALEIPYGGSYAEMGWSLQFSGSLVVRQGKNLTVPLNIRGSVDPNKVGTYPIEYQARFLFWTARAIRTVRVVDRIVPEISLVDDPNSLTVYGHPYVEEGYLAWDEYDGDLTQSVQREEKDGRVIYTVEDSSGNVAVVTRRIRYHDPEPPAITLEGGAEVTMNAGAPYEDPGVTVLDNYDGDLSDAVVVTGEVIPYLPGTYTLTYTATDSFGNTATAYRTVNVVPCPRVPTVYPEGKVIYLTFDDGPGAYTEELLDILAEYDVKATFFLTGTGYYDLLERMAREGHSLGIHSVTHNYRQIYSSEEAFFADLYAMQQIIYDHTGVRTTLLRFPGGSSNTVSAKYNKGITTRLAQMVQDAGFQYFDWNADSRDAAGAKNENEVFQSVTGGVQAQRYSVVLHHDIHRVSIDAVERIIRWGLANGYTFLPLTPDSPQCHHGIAN